MAKHGATLWDAIGAPLSTSDPNSREAAESMLGAVGTIRHQVAAYIANHGPISERQLEDALDYDGNTIRPRIVELSRAGIIARCEETGVTPSGRKCYLHVATEMGRRLLDGTDVDDESAPAKLVVGSMAIFEGIPKAPIGETLPFYGLPVVTNSFLNPDQWVCLDSHGRVIQRGGNWPAPSPETEEKK